MLESHENAIYIFRGWHESCLISCRYARMTTEELCNSESWLSFGNVHLKCSDANRVRLRVYTSGKAIGSQQAIGWRSILCDMRDSWSCCRPLRSRFSESCFALLGPRRGIDRGVTVLALSFKPRNVGNATASCELVSMVKTRLVSPFVDLFSALCDDMSRPGSALIPVRTALALC